MSVTRVRRIFVTSGLMMYGGIAIAAIVATLANRTMNLALVPSIVVSLPWSLIADFHEVEKPHNFPPQE
jgi:hypothetical protein